MPRAEWDDPVLQDDVEAEVANLIHRRDLERAHAEMTAAAELFEAKAATAKGSRDKYDANGRERDQRLWYKFHGQMQANQAAAKHFRKGASNVWSRLAEGETVL